MNAEVTLEHPFLDQAVCISTAMAFQKSVVLAPEEVATMKSGEASECGFTFGIPESLDGHFAIVISHSTIVIKTRS